VEIGRDKHLIKGSPLLKSFNSFSSSCNFLNNFLIFSIIIFELWIVIVFLCLLTFIFFGLFSYYSYDTYWSGMHIGFPIKYYIETGFIPSCEPTPCQGSYFPSLPVYLTIVFILIDLLVYYIISSVVVYSISKIVNRRKTARA
jgi:hypothetical protein